ncbi:MAG: hypothetical protein AAGC55_20235, partial [Myxococcota bacterium]
MSLPRNSLKHPSIPSLALLCLAVVACGSDDDGDGPNIISLEIAPSPVTLEVIDGVPVEQSFTVTAELIDGSIEDVTEQVIFTIDRTSLGQFDGSQFTARGAQAGLGQITASYQSATAEAELRVNIRTTTIVDPAPADAAALFDAATDEPGRAPAIVYPQDQTVVPANLGDYEVHWTDPSDNDLFEVAITTEYLDLRSYMTAAPGAGSYAALDPSLWNMIRNSHRGEAITVTVRGLATSAPGTAGTSAALTTRLARSDLEGGIYYWASVSNSGPGGIYRHDMGRTDAQAEPFYTTNEAPDGRCVACHVLSRDGARMAVTYDGGNGAGTILEVSTRTTMLPVDGTFAWNFGTFTPSGEQFLGASSGALTLRASTTGEVLATVPTGYATHPDFHPGGTAITYVTTPSPSNDWTFTNGSIMTQSFDPLTNTFSDEVVLVTGGGNNYYPSWSPDGEWILFNRSSEDAYDDASAELWVVKADGTVPPIRFDSPNLGPSLTNSWGRWAPFAQELDATGEPFFWLTFSSKRNFGVRLVDQNRPQIWMAPF